MTFSIQKNISRIRAKTQQMKKFVQSLFIWKEIKCDIACESSTSRQFTLYKCTKSYLVSIRSSQIWKCCKLTPYNSFPAGGDFCRLLITLAKGYKKYIFLISRKNGWALSYSTDLCQRTQIHKMLVLIWIQTVWHSDGVPERFFWKSSFWKVSRQQQMHEKLQSMQKVKGLT